LEFISESQVDMSALYGECMFNGYFFTTVLESFHKHFEITLTFLYKIYNGVRVCAWVCVSTYSKTCYLELQCVLNYCRFFGDTL